MMKRRITMLFPVLLFAVLILFVFTPHAEAAGHGSEHSGWTAWTSTTSLPSTSGKYYLTNNVALRSTWEVSRGEDICLCLNGKTISTTLSCESVITVEIGGSLRIEDCSSSQSGLISGSGNVQTSCVSVNGTFTIYEGTIANTVTGYYGGVSVNSGGIAYLYGGVIRNNKASSGYGGGLHVGEGGKAYIDGCEIHTNEARFGGGIGSDGTVTLYRGSIHDNEASLDSMGGGGIFINNRGSLSMEGGKIYGNHTAGCGGGIFIAGTNGRAIITGGSIYNNTSDCDGGGIRNNGGSLSVSAEIYGNSSPVGGGIYSLGNSHLYDCRIHDNTASEQGGGVFFQNGNPSVAGRLRIEGNKLADGTLSNLCLPENSQTIHVTDELDGDSEICISLANPPAATEKLTLTSGLKEKSGSSVSSPEQVFSFDDWRTCGAIWNDGETEAVVIRIPKCTSLPQDVTAAEGAYATFSVGVSGISVSYQWEYYNASTEEWTEINGATGAKYTTTATAQKNGRLYRVHVMNPVGGFYTASAKLTVASKPVITKQPKTLIVSLNATASFTLTASGTGLSYQWQYSTDDGKTWHDSTQTGAKTSSLSVESLSKRNGYQYRCNVKNAAGNTTSVAVQLLISGVKPVIRSQTNAITSAANVTVTFKVSAAGTGLSYQWQYSSDNGKTWHNSSMTGYNTAAMKVPVVSGRNGYLYRCTVKNSSGSVTSSPAKLTVSGVKPVIRDQSKAITSSPNVTVTFKVAAAGVGLKYKWQYSNDGGKTWHDSTMTGYNTAAMKVPVTTARNGYQYRCIVSNSYGSVTSSPAKLTVK